MVEKGLALINLSDLELLAQLSALVLGIVLNMTGANPAERHSRASVLCPLRTTKCGAYFDTLRTRGCNRVFLRANTIICTSHRLAQPPCTQMPDHRIVALEFSTGGDTPKRLCQSFLLLLFLQLGGDLGCGPQCPSQCFLRGILSSCAKKQARSKVHDNAPTRVVIGTFS